MSDSTLYCSRCGGPMSYSAAALRVQCPKCRGAKGAAPKERGAAAPASPASAAAKARAAENQTVARWDSRQETPRVPVPKIPRSKAAPEPDGEAGDCLSDVTGTLALDFAVAHQGKLPHIDGGKQSNQIVLPEAALQRAIIARLSYDGFLPLETSEHRRATSCPHCHGRFIPGGGRGCDKGVPDLLVTHHLWPTGVFLGVEVKGAKTPLSPEQKILHERGRIVIVRSVSEARIAVFATHRALLQSVAE